MLLIHPSLPEDQVPFECAPETFELVWKRRGWEPAPEPPPEDTEADYTALDQPAQGSQTTTRPKKENRP